MKGVGKLIGACLLAVSANTMAVTTLDQCAPDDLRCKTDAALQYSDCIDPGITDTQDVSQAYQKVGENYILNCMNCHTQQAFRDYFTRNNISLSDVAAAEEFLKTDPSSPFAEQFYCTCYDSIEDTTTTTAGACAEEFGSQTSWGSYCTTGSRFPFHYGDCPPFSALIDDTCTIPSSAINANDPNFSDYVLLMVKGVLN